MRNRAYGFLVLVGVIEHGQSRNKSYNDDVVLLALQHHCLYLTRRQVLRYKSVTIKYVGHENAGYIKFRYLHNTISDFYETSHTLNRHIVLIRDKTIRVRNDTL